MIVYGGSVKTPCDDGRKIELFLALKLEKYKMSYSFDIKNPEKKRVIAACEKCLGLFRQSPLGHLISDKEKVSTLHKRLNQTGVIKEEKERDAFVSGLKSLLKLNHDRFIKSFPTDTIVDDLGNPTYVSDSILSSADIALIEAWKSDCDKGLDVHIV